MHSNIFQYLTLKDARAMGAHCPEARSHVARRETVAVPFQYWRSCTIQRRWTRAGLGMLKGRFPVLDFQERFMGGTCYLDGIIRTDPSHPVMVGRDRHGRGFLTIRYRCTETWTFDDEVHPASPDAVHFLTVFQRYTEIDMWCKVDRPCHAHSAPLLRCAGTALNDEELRLLVANIFRMGANEPIRYMDYESPSEQTPAIERSVHCVLDV